MSNPIPPPQIGLPQSYTFSSWDQWLSDVHTYLESLGYKKYKQKYKNEDFSYWKTFKDSNQKLYQVAILFYDFRKYADVDPHSNRIGIQYESLLIGDSRIDLSVSKDITISQFEEMANSFYQTFKSYIQPYPYE